MERLYPKASFNQVAKHPLVYALMIVGLLMGIFAHNWINASGLVNENCQEEIARLRIEIEHLRKDSEEKDRRLFDLMNELLIKNQIIRNTDSVARIKVGQPAKEIVKGGLE